MLLIPRRVTFKSLLIIGPCNGVGGGMGLNVGDLLGNGVGRAVGDNVGDTVGLKVGRVVG